MESWIDAIVKFVIVSSALIFVIGGVSFLVLQTLRIQGRARLWICRIVMLVPVFYTLQPLLPGYIRLIIPLESTLLTIEPSKASISWKTIIIIIWGVLLFIYMIRLLFTVKKIRSLLKSADHVTDPHVPALLRKCAAETGLKRVPRLLMVEDMLVPMAIGCIHPAIVIPKHLLEPNRREGLRFTLLHEMKHIQHLDNWWLLIESLINAIYFFHPIIHWAKQRIHEEMEFLCDDHVIQVTKRSGSYADFLLLEIWSRSQIMNSAIAMPFISNAPKTKKRIHAILEKRRTTTSSKIRDRLALSFILISFTSLLLCTVTPSMMKRDKNTEIQIAADVPSGKDNVSNSQKYEDSSYFFYNNKKHSHIWFD